MGVKLRSLLIAPFRPTLRKLVHIWKFDNGFQVAFLDGGTRVEISKGPTYIGVHTDRTKVLSATIGQKVEDKYDGNYRESVVHVGGSCVAMRVGDESISVDLGDYPMRSSCLSVAVNGARHRFQWGKPGANWRIGDLSVRYTSATANEAAWLVYKADDATRKAESAQAN